MVKKIPKIIHQIWIGPNPAPFIWINTWRFDYLKKNPKWRYKLWTDDNIKRLKYLDWKRYNQEATWNGKSDFLRFAILKEFGGVYIDADSVSIEGRSLSPLLLKAESGFFAAWEDHNGPDQKTIAGGVCGSWKNHPVVNKIIAVQNDRWDQYHDTLQAWQTVGPLAVQKGIEACRPEQSTIFPSKYFYPVWWHHYTEHFVKVDLTQFPDSYMYQFGYSTNSYANHKVDMRDTESREYMVNPGVNKTEKDFIILDPKNAVKDYNKLVEEYCHYKGNVLKKQDSVYVFHHAFWEEHLNGTGISFLIRAKNEEANVDVCLKSLLPVLEKFPQTEVVFVDNGSTDQTWEIAQKYSNNYSNIKTFRYTEPIAKTGANYRKQLSENSKASIAKFYNWCVEKSSKTIVLKWDADFIARTDALNEMIKEYDLTTTKTDLALWFTGETLFEHQGRWHVKTNSYYDEYRGFHKKYTKWVDADKCEALDISKKAVRHKFIKPVFYEVKRTSIDEFSSRGEVIDRRDLEDREIIENLMKGKTSDTFREIEL